MNLKDVAKEMIDMWQLSINEERPLTPDEKQYILNLQERAIQEHMIDNDGLSEEELKAEYFANHQIDYFRDRDRSKN